MIIIRKKIYEKIEKNNISGDSIKRKKKYLDFLFYLTIFKL